MDLGDLFPQDVQNQGHLFLQKETSMAAPPLNHKFHSQEPIFPASTFRVDIDPE